MIPQADLPYEIRKIHKNIATAPNYETAYLTGACVCMSMSPLRYACRRFQPTDNIAGATAMD
jgi:hypothetical protein